MTTYKMEMTGTQKWGPHYSVSEIRDNFDEELPYVDRLEWNEDVLGYMATLNDGREILFDMVGDDDEEYIPYFSSDSDLDNLTIEEVWLFCSMAKDTNDVVGDFLNKAAHSLDNGVVLDGSEFNKIEKPDNTLSM